MFPLKSEFRVLEYLTTDVQSLNITNYTAVMMTQLQVIAVEHRYVSPMLDDFTEKHASSSSSLSLFLLSSFICT